MVCDWLARIAALDRATPPPPMSLQRWHELLADADTFLRQWGQQALDLGWEPIELFGCSPGFARRLDRDDLVMLLRGRPVVAMTRQYQHHRAAVAQPRAQPG